MLGFQTLQGVITTIVKNDLQQMIKMLEFPTLLRISSKINGLEEA